MLRCRQELVTVHELRLPAVVTSRVLVAAPEVNPTDVDPVSEGLHLWLENESM